MRFYFQNGVCLLPKADDPVRRLKMLENDIAEIAGRHEMQGGFAPRRGKLCNG